MLTSIEVECERRRATPRPAASLHGRVHARADQALPRARDHRPPAQRERDRPLAVRRAQRRASRPQRAGERTTRLRRSDRRARQRTRRRGVARPYRRHAGGPLGAGRRAAAARAARRRARGGPRHAARRARGAARDRRRPRARGASSSRTRSPGRRYVDRQGPERCDIVVDGAYASRRHGEVWFDHDGWWVADAGSTNGIRVESGDGGIARTGVTIRAAPPGGRRSRWRPARVVVLSAHAEGDAARVPARCASRSRAAGTQASRHRRGDAHGARRRRSRRPAQRARALSIDGAHGVGRAYAIDLGLGIAAVSASVARAPGARGRRRARRRVGTPRRDRRVDDAGRVGRRARRQRRRRRRRRLSSRARASR